MFTIVLRDTGAQFDVVTAGNIQRERKQTQNFDMQEKRA